MSIRIFVALAIVFFCATVSAAQTDVVIALDLSKSMDHNDQFRYRFIGADVALTMFAFYGTDNRGGVVSFGDGTSEVIRLEHLSADQFAKYKPILDRLGSEDWTELGQGLSRSKEMMGPSERKKSIILISDGKVEGNPNVRGVSPERAKEQAEKELWSAIVPSLKAARISVYTIGLFNEGQGDEKTLKGIADQTGGFYAHVRNPEEFPQIYKRMLDDIDHPSGVAELSNGSSILLTPFDQAVIVLGPTGFVLKGPDNLSYSTGKETAETPVKQKSFEYNNKTAILFLGRPDNIESNGQFWNGKWSVEDMNGKGEATFISKVRLVRDPSLPNRREYFLNEYYPIQYQFMTGSGIDAESILSKCRAEFILAPRKPSNAPPVLEPITRQGRVFTSETLLNNEGDYVFTIKMYYDNVNIERWSQPDNFHVSKTPLITLSNPSGPAYVGSNFRIEAQPATFGTAGLPEARGLVDSTINFSLRYGLDEPIPIPQSKQDAGVFRTDELQFAKAGDLEIRGVLNGNLLMQLTGPNGEDIFTPYKVKALVAKKLEVQGVLWRTLLRETAIWGSTAVSLFASALGIFGFLYQRPRFGRLDKATLMGQGRGATPIRLKPQGLDERWQARWFTKLRPAVSVGGPQSHADIKDSRFQAAQGRSVFEIAIKDDKYYITSTGALDVRLAGRPLEPNQPRLITKDEVVSIPEVEAAFTFHS